MRSILLLIAPLLGAPASTPQDPPVQDPPGIDTNRAPLLEHAKLRQAMARLASERADLVSRFVIGKSRGDRDIEALRIAAGDEPHLRPAILIVANIDGPLVYTSGVALELARMLAERYATDVGVRELLDTTSIYVVPRANPDAAEARFRAPLAEVRASGHGVDDDRDGRMGEDGPADVDLDGLVTVMRIRDPEGTWIADPTDPRALIEADRSKGERGVWRLETEGRDSDGDELVAEDPERDAEVNRNFPAEWEEHTPRAGLYASAEPETRALCEFVMANRNIQLVLVFGEQDNLVDDPDSVADDAPASDRVPPSGVRESDATLLRELGRRYREATGSEVTAADGDRAGTFQEWCYSHRGLLTLSATLWSVPLDGDPGDDGDDEGDEDAPEPSDDAKRLAWADARGLAGFHLGWTAFEHPELGAVEIGGFRPYALVEPPDEERVTIADAQFAHLLTLGASLARVRLVEAEARDLGGGVLRVTAVLENDSLMPLVTTWGQRTRTTRPAKVLLRIPEQAELLAGSRQQLVSDLPGAGGRHELDWLVRGVTAGSIGISVETDHAGSARAIPEVK